MVNGEFICDHLHLLFSISSAVIGRILAIQDVHYAFSSFQCSQVILSVEAGQADIQLSIAAKDGKETNAPKNLLPSKPVLLHISGVCSARQLLEAKEKSR